MNEFERLYELQGMCDKCGEPSNCYFDNLDELLKIQKQLYTSLASELNRLDIESWKFVKKECGNELCQHDERRGWAQLFNKLNETKGYGYLLDQGCKKVQFIPRSKKNGIETPDLLGLIDEYKIICEVKTINHSDIEIDRRNKRECKEVVYQLNEGLCSQLKKIITKAKNQLNGYDPGNVLKRIVYIVVNNDDWQPEVSPTILEKIKGYVNNFVSDGIEIKVHLT